MARPKKYPDELIARGVRLALESGRPIAASLGLPSARGVVGIDQRRLVVQTVGGSSPLAHPFAQSQRGIATMHAVAAASANRRRGALGRRRSSSQAYDATHRHDATTISSLSLPPCGTPLPRAFWGAVTSHGRPPSACWPRVPLVDQSDYLVLSAEPSGTSAPG